MYNFIVFNTRIDLPLDKGDIFRILMVASFDTALSYFCSGMLAQDILVYL